MQPPQYPPHIQTPDGVLPGTKAIREALTPQRVRVLSDGEHEDLQRAGIEGENGYQDPVDPGINPWDVYSRTWVYTVEEAKEFAVAIALQLPRLRHDPRWAQAPWIDMPIMTAAYHIELVLRKSIGRFSLIEALMAKVGMYSPDPFIAISQVRQGRGRKRRPEQEG